MKMDIAHVLIKETNRFTERYIFFDELHDAI